MRQIAFGKSFRKRYGGRTKYKKIVLMTKIKNELNYKTNPQNKITLGIVKEIRSKIIKAFAILALSYVPEAIFHNVLQILSTMHPV